MNLRFDFTDRSVVVTGGAQGIGLQIAQEFLAAGASVCIWDRSEQAMAAAREKLPGATFMSVDVSDAASCKAAAAKLPFSQLDILVNNAGITRDKSFLKMTDEEFDAVVQVNLASVFRVSRALFDSFKSDSFVAGGVATKRIINLSSIVGIYGNFGQANYAAAKAGVIGLTKTLARELARKGFTVNAIAPGFIRTAMTAAMPQQAIDGMVAKIPAARLGKTNDIASACLFLASEEASYINGTVLSVDGGLVV